MTISPRLPSDRRRQRPFPAEASLRLVVPWWAHPVWALLMLTGTMCVISIGAQQTTYDQWLVQKFITGDLALVLVILFLCLTVGALFATGLSPRARTIDIHLDSATIRLLNKAHRILFWLTLIGYATWILSAIAQGVGLSNLVAVLERAPGAIGELKNNARPIGGVTTLTQFGPIAVALNLLLWKAGMRHPRALTFFFVGATVRFFFYAERLALIELLIPAALVGSMILGASPKWRRRLALIPAIAAPAVWLVFAASEYFRSWIYYSQQTDMPFFEWVTVRLLGYYTTSFNNSALIAQSYDSNSPLPWFTLQWFWNLPGVRSLIEHPGISGIAADQWWTYTLTNNANINFTNPGSFLTTYAEMGIIGAALVWLITGLVIGFLFNSLSKGNVPSLLFYACIFVGILELPRIVYWTLGRSTPIVIAFLFLAHFWGKYSKTHTRRLRADLLLAGGVIPAAPASKA